MNMTISMRSDVLFRITLGLLAGSAAFGQPTAPKPAAAPAFEVATVKPSAPLDMAAVRAGTAHTGTKINAARVDIGTASLFRLICIAYRVKPYQVTGPDWLTTTMYDIQAKIPDGGTADQVPEMLQTLLADRFGLKIRHELKDQQVYALVILPGGPKLKESVPEPEPPAPAPDAPKPTEMSLPTTQGDVKLTRAADGVNIEMPGQISGKVHMTLNQGPGQLSGIHAEVPGATMKTFAEILSTGVVERPVVDLTRLDGRYDLAVDMSMLDAMNAARAVTGLGAGGGGDGGNPGASGIASDPAGTSIFTSIQKLGLKLEPRKMPLDLVIVDHMEKTPTAN
jgi:uncharacterized protein (TIGR03435 family)